MGSRGGQLASKSLIDQTTPNRESRNSEFLTFTGEQHNSKLGLVSLSRSGGSTGGGTCVTTGTQFAQRDLWRVFSNEWACLAHCWQLAMAQSSNKK